MEQYWNLLTKFFSNITKEANLYTPFVEDFPKKVFCKGSINSSIREGEGNPKPLKFFLRLIKGWMYEVITFFKISHFDCRAWRCCFFKLKWLFFLSSSGPLYSDTIIQDLWWSDAICSSPARIQGIRHPPAILYITIGHSGKAYKNCSIIGITQQTLENTQSQKHTKSKLVYAYTEDFLCDSSLKTCAKCKSGWCEFVPAENFENKDKNGLFGYKNALNMT